MLEGAKQNKYKGPRFQRKSYNSDNGHRQRRIQEPENKGLEPGLPVLYPCDRSNPEKVVNWHRALGTYAMKNYVRGMESVFKFNDPSIPDMVEPRYEDEDDDEILEEDPAIRAQIKMQKWKTKHGVWSDYIKRRDNDVNRAFGLAVGQMSIPSIDRISAFPAGKAAMDHTDIIGLIQSVPATHLSGGDPDEQNNFYLAETNFHKLNMHEDESITSYHRRFAASFEAMKESARAAEKMDKLPGDDQLVMKFIYSLSHRYSEYQTAFRRKQVPVPDSLLDAMTRIQNFGSNKQPGGSNFANYKGVFATRRAGGRYGEKHGGRGGGRDGGRAASRGSCYKCGKPGHWQYDCPEKDDAEVSSTVADAKKSSDRKQKN